MNFASSSEISRLPGSYEQLLKHDKNRYINLASYVHVSQVFAMEVSIESDISGKRDVFRAAYYYS